MNTLAGDENPANVTLIEYGTTGALIDYASGIELPVTVSATTTTPGGADQYADGGPTDSGTEAHALFDGIVDLTGSDQLASGESSTLTFTGLDPEKTYAVTLSANRDDPASAENQYSRVSIAGAEAAVAASSDNVISNTDGSVSFSVGDNSANGTIVRWIAIDPGADGEFTVTSSWDETQGSVAAGTAPNTHGYAMAAFKLETFVDVTAPAVSIVSPSIDAVALSAVAIEGTSSDNVGIVEVALEILDLTTGQWWTGSAWQESQTSFAAYLNDVGEPETTWTFEFDPEATEATAYQVTASALDAAGIWSVEATRGFSIE